LFCATKASTFFSDLMTSKPTTRDRIVREATRLFASQGIKATTVAQIEVAVGLRKGSGGVHRYFATKDELVHAVLETQLDDARGTLAESLAWPAPTPEQVRPFLEAVGAFALAESERNRDVALIMLRDGHALGTEQLDEQRRKNYEIAFASTAAAVRDMQARSGADFGVDADALGFIFMAPIVYFRLIEWATGHRVLGIDDATLISTWTTVFEPVFRQLAAANDAAPPQPDVPAAKPNRRPKTRLT
jgi:AcrR family transcriptional regulator